MKHSIDTINGLHLITISLEDLYREYMRSCITDIIWDMYDGDRSLEPSFINGIQALRNAQEKEIVEMFKSGETNMMLGRLMETLESLDDLEEPYILVITNPRNPKQSIIIPAKDISY